MSAEHPTRYERLADHILEILEASGHAVFQPGHPVRTFVHNTIIDVLIEESFNTPEENTE
jgi:hypothetical protein